MTASNETEIALLKAQVADILVSQRAMQDSMTRRETERAAEKVKYLVGLIGLMGTVMVFMASPLLTVLHGIFNSGGKP